MVKLQTISTAYSSYSDPAFIELGENIVVGLTANPHYPEPPQALTLLSALLVKLASAVRAMRTGLRAATQQRDFVRNQAEVFFRGLSAYCTAATPGRADLWAEANFPLTRADTTPRQPSQPVGGLVLADGPSTQMLLGKVDTQVGMYGYAWRIYPKDTAPEALAAGFCYRFCLTRESRVVIDGLESGTSYGVECAAWNNTGPLQWSAPVFRIVQ